MKKIKAEVSKNRINWVRFFKKIFDGKRERISMEEFLRLTKLEYDDKNFRYFLVNPISVRKPPETIWWIEAGIVWQADKDKDLLNLSRVIMRYVDWEFPVVYGFGTRKDNSSNQYV